ncbi:MAG: hypothetical protein ABI807_11335 [Sporichthyaceae bacterium]
MDWIEQLTGWDPDHGSGMVELGLVFLVVAMALLLSPAVRMFLARPRHRRARTR